MKDEEEIKKIREFYRRRGFKKKIIDELVVKSQRWKDYETEIF